MKDLVEAMYALYGGATNHMSMRPSPGGGGGEHLDDWAARWLRGEREAVEAEIAKREARLRAMPVIVKPVRARARRIDAGRVKALRAAGATLAKIAAECECSITRASEICRS